jgi:hypothetical protein
MLPQALLLTDRREIAKKIRGFATPLGEALAVFGHGTIKKIISMAAWGGIIFFIAAVLAI